MMAYHIINLTSFFKDAESKCRFYQDRYTAVHQRTARHKLFTPTVAVGGVSTSPTTRKYQLKTVDYLLGTSGKLSDIIVLGALSQIKVNKYSLEDPTGIVDLVRKIKLKLFWSCWI